MDLILIIVSIYNFVKSRSQKDENGNYTEEGKFRIQRAAVTFSLAVVLDIVCVIILNFV